MFRREPNGQWRSSDYEDRIQQDKVNLDTFWIKDESLEDSDNLPEPDVILQEIIEDLEGGALAQLRGIAEDLGQESLT
jgi:type I restriction enzyme M protein